MVITECFFGLDSKMNHDYHQEAGRKGATHLFIPNFQNGFERKDIH